MIFFIEFCGDKTILMEKQNISNNCVESFTWRSNLTQNQEARVYQGLPQNHD